MFNCWFLSCLSVNASILCCRMQNEREGVLVVWKVSMWPLRFWLLANGASSCQELLGYVKERLGSILCSLTGVLLHHIMKTDPYPIYGMTLCTR